MGRMRGWMPLFAPWKSWRESPLNTTLKTRYIHTYTHTRPQAHNSMKDAAVTLLSYILRILKNTHAHMQYKYTCTCTFMPHAWAGVWVYGCSLLLWVSVTWLVCVSLHVCALVSLCSCVGFLRGGVLAVEQPRAVCFGAGSQHPLLQEEVSGVGQVCGAALPPRC